MMILLLRSNLTWSFINTEISICLTLFYTIGGIFALCQFFSNKPLQKKTI